MRQPTEPVRPAPPLAAVLLIVAALLATAAAIPGPAAAQSGPFYASVVSNGSRANPVVALTFDDGNDARQALTIMDVLRRSGVPATFFPFAKAMTDAPQAWREIAAAGFLIGNHTFSHPVLTALPGWAQRQELAGAAATVQRITGAPPIPVFRPPYGAWNGTLAANAAALGYPTLLLWDVDPRDWSGIPAWLIAERVVSRARNGSVILLHAGPYHTAEALPAIIAGLRARGFGFVTVPQLLGGVGVPVAVPPRIEVLRVSAVRPTPSGLHRPAVRPAPAATRWRQQAALEAGYRPIQPRRVDLATGDWSAIGVALAEQAFVPSLGGVFLTAISQRANVPAWAAGVAVSTAAVSTGVLDLARTLLQWVHR